MDENIYNIKNVSLSNNQKKYFNGPRTELSNKLVYIANN